MKTCTLCRQSKPESEYHKSWQARDGLQGRCKECVRDGDRGRIRTQLAGTVEPPPEKTCTRCGETKPSTEFYRHKQAKTGLQSQCKRCINSSNDDWKLRNLDKAKEMLARGSRRSHVRRQYGLERSEYERMVEQAHGLCACCGNPERIQYKDGRTWALCVDHDHQTGAVRGLICHDCNRMLGYSGDSIERLEHGAAYLRRYQG